MISAKEALSFLREGNQRFVNNKPSVASASAAARRAGLVAGQSPFAIIIGCSDSRVPAELVFDQGFGDLFVIRVAGNVVAPIEIGSVEFAASRYGTQLAVVLGHSKCGAIEATLAEMLDGHETEFQNLRSIVDLVKPSLEAMFATGAPADRKELMQAAVRANVAASVAQLRHGSELVERFIREERLLVVGAEYSLESGIVTFFEGEAAEPESPARVRWA